MFTKATSGGSESDAARVNHVSANGRLLVFAKAPVPGRVKTRLIPPLGPRGAAAVQRRLVRAALAAALAGSPWPLELHVPPPLGHPFFAACRRDLGLRLAAQRGPDLGARMAHALGAALGEVDAAVLMGSDCPALTPADVAEAAAALEAGYDAVLGPALDGGYYLIGLRRPQPRLFRGMPWGGPRVLALTRARLRASGLAWHELPPRADLDRPADLHLLRLLQRAAASPRP
jgi:rSAM/selenodomain-associated transferase 1